MAGRLYHGPGDVLRFALIADGVGTLPSAGGAWPVEYPREPTSPDEVVTVRNTAGVQEGLTGPDEERQEHHGVQIRIRAREPRSGWDKANAVAVRLDKIRNVDVTVPNPSPAAATVYRLLAITRGDVIDLGKEVGTSDRNVYTINALVDLELKT